MAWDKAILCRTGVYMWYLSEELTDEVMDNLEHAWFPDTDIIRLVPELTDFPYGPENMIVKAATPDMALNPLFDPNAASAVPPSGPPSESVIDPWLVPKSTNFPKRTLSVQTAASHVNLRLTMDASRRQRSLELHGLNGNTRLEPVQQQLCGFGLNH